MKDRPPSEQTNKPFIKGEKIIQAVYGILKQGVYTSNYNLENSILVMNKRIIFFHVNVLGNSLNQGNSFNVWFRKKYKEVGDKMISSMNPMQILNSNSENKAINFHEIVNVEFKKPILNYAYLKIGANIIIIRTQDNKKYNYIIFYKDDLLQLKETLPRLILVSDRTR